MKLLDRREHSPISRSGPLPGMYLTVLAPPMQGLGKGKGKGKAKRRLLLQGGGSAAELRSLSEPTDVSCMELHGSLPVP